MVVSEERDKMAELAWEKAVQPKIVSRVRIVLLIIKVS